MQRAEGLFLKGQVVFCCQPGDCASPRWPQSGGHGRGRSAWIATVFLAAKYVCAIDCEKMTPKRPLFYLQVYCPTL